MFRSSYAKSIRRIYHAKKTGHCRCRLSGMSEKTGQRSYYDGHYKRNRSVSGRNLQILSGFGCHFTSHDFKA